MNDWQTEDHLIECAQCGESFDLSLTHCPHCGVSVYPLDGEEVALENGLAHQPPGELALWGHSAGLLTVCGLTAAAVSLLAYMVVRNLTLNQAGEVAFWIAISLCVALGSFAGAYLAGRFARQRFILHGLLTGAINLATLLLLLAREFEVAAGLDLDTAGRGLEPAGGLRRRLPGGGTDAAGAGQGPVRTCPGSG